MTKWSALPDTAIKRDISVILLDGTRVHTDAIYLPVSIRRIERFGEWHYCIQDIEIFLEKKLPQVEKTVEHPEDGVLYANRDSIVEALSDIMLDNYQSIVLGHYLNNETL